MMREMLITLVATLLSMGAGTSLADHRLGERALLGGAIGGGTGAYLGAELGGRDGALLGAALGGLTGTHLATERHQRGRHGKPSRSRRWHAPAHPRHHHGGPRLRLMPRGLQPHRFGKPPSRRHGKRPSHRYGPRHGSRYEAPRRGFRFKGPRRGPPHCPRGLRRKGRC